MSGGKQVKKTAEQVEYTRIFFAVLKGASLLLQCKTAFIQNPDGGSDLIAGKLHAVNGFVILFHVCPLPFFTYII